MEQMKWSTKLEYGVGTIGKSLSYGLSSARILYYVNNVLKLNQTFSTFLFLFGRLWDGINDLLMGTVIDNTKSRMGKFRPWIMLGAVTNAFVVVAMFYKPNLSGAMLLVYITAMYLLNDLTYTMVDVSYWSMIPALSLDSKERDQVSMIPRIFGGVAGIVSAFFWQIIDKLGGRGVNQGFFKYAMITSAVYIATSVYSGIRVKERVEPPKEQQAGFSLAQAARILFQNKQALVVVVIMILFNLANNLTNETAQFYFLDVMDNKENLYSFYTILIGASQAIGLFGFPIFSKKFGRHRVYTLSIVVPIAGYVLMFLANSLFFGSFVPLAVAAFVMSAGYGSMGVMQNVMLADAVDYGEYQTGQRNEGIIFSTLTFLSKVAAGLSSAITLTGFRFAKFGGEHSTDTVANPQAVFCIKFLMYMLPPLLLLVTWYIYHKKFKLKPELMSEVTLEIQRRRADGGAAPDEPVSAE